MWTTMYSKYYYGGEKGEGMGGGGSALIQFCKSNLQQSVFNKICACTKFNKIVINYLSCLWLMMVK